MKKNKMMMTNVKEQKERKGNLLPTQIRTMTCYKRDPSSCQGGYPTTNKTAAVLTTAKIWS